MGRAGLLRLFKVMGSDAFTVPRTKRNELTRALLEAHYRQPTPLPTLIEQRPYLSAYFDHPAAISFKSVWI
jgi:hypothetical protein